MRKNYLKIVSILLIVVGLISISSNTHAHSGRTDSSGGHKDKNNVSGLGSYHYHCGGNPAHLHDNGGCPYSSNSSSNKASTTSSSSSTTKTTSTKTNTTTTSVVTTRTVPETIEVTDIQINENVESLKVGERKKLTATITPSNATDKNIIWKSSDESIATISSTGEIIPKKSGIVEITATSSNGKKSVVKINIQEELKVEKNDIVETDTTTKNKITNNTTKQKDNKEDSNPLAGLIMFGTLGGGGYWGYKKYKKSK